MQSTEENTPNTMDLIVRGQQEADLQRELTERLRKEIDAYLNTVRGFIRQANISMDAWQSCNTSIIGDQEGYYLFLRITMDDGFVFTRTRQKGCAWPHVYLNRLTDEEVVFVHERLSTTIDQLMKNLGVWEEFTEFFAKLMEKGKKALTAPPEKPIVEVCFYFDGKALEAVLADSTRRRELDAKSTYIGVNRVELNFPPDLLQKFSAAALERLEQAIVDNAYSE